MPISARAIASAIPADSERQKPTRNDVAKYFLCGRAYMRKLRTGDDNPNFCSQRCIDAYDIAGLRPHHQADFDPFAVKAWRIVAGEPCYRPRAMEIMGDGFRINCRTCGVAFKSRGLAYCSNECAREGRSSAKSERMCAAPDYGRAIPEFRHRRRVSAKARYCSDACRYRAHYKRPKSAA